MEAAPLCLAWLKLKPCLCCAPDPPHEQEQPAHPASGPDKAGGRAGEELLLPPAGLPADSVRKAEGRVLPAGCSGPGEQRPALRQVLSAPSPQTGLGGLAAVRCPVLAGARWEGEGWVFCWTPAACASQEVPSLAPAVPAASARPALLPAQADNAASLLSLPANPAAPGQTQNAMPPGAPGSGHLEPNSGRLLCVAETMVQRFSLRRQLSKVGSGFRVWGEPLPLRCCPGGSASSGRGGSPGRLLFFL